MKVYPDETKETWRKSVMLFSLWLLMLIIVVLTMASCRSVQYVPVETIQHDSIYFTKLQKDSVYLKEYVNVYQKADTVYNEKIIIKYKEKLAIDTLYITKIDSIYQEKIVEVEKPLTIWQKGFMGIGKIASGIIILLLLWMIIVLMVKLKR